MHNYERVNDSIQWVGNLNVFVSLLKTWTLFDIPDIWHKFSFLKNSYGHLKYLKSSVIFIWE